MISGDGGIGKSLLMQQLVTAAAIGGYWLGKSVDQCPCVAIWCEDDRDELWRRQERINQHYGCSHTDLSNLTYIERCGEESILMDWGKYGNEEKFSTFYTQLTFEIINRKAKILILDTVSDVFGGNENYRNQVRRFIAALRKLAIRMQGCVILTSHPSMAGRASGTGESGSTAWQNAVRCRMYLTSVKDAGTNRRVLKTMKANQAKAGSEIQLEWDQGVFRLADASQPAASNDRPTFDWTF